MKSLNTKKFISLVLLLGLCIFVLSSTAEAATYYVDFDNGSDSNDGLSQVNAWRNVPGTRNAGDTGWVSGSSGWVKINAGDIIYIKSGTTHDSNDGGRIYITNTYYNNGTFSQPIKIRRDTNWGTGQIVIDGTGISVPKYHGVVDIFKQDYVIIDGSLNNGIKVQDSGVNGIRIFDSGINGSELRNLEVYNSQRANVRIASSQKSIPVYIGNVTVYNVEAHKTSNGDDNSSNITVTFGENILIENCTAYDSYGKADGIHLGSSRYSWIENCTAYSYDANDKGQGIDLSRDGDYKPRDDSYEITVRNCIAYGSYKSNFDFNSGVHNVYYIGNVGWQTTINETGDGNIYLYQGTAGKNFWINNTTTKGKDWGYGMTWGSNRWDIPAGIYQQYFINNISSEDTGESVCIRDSYEGRVFGTNYYNSNFYSVSGTTAVYDKGMSYTRDNINNGTGGWTGTDCIAQDPLFVANGSTWAATDLNLQASSPCINAGVFPFTTASSGSGTVVVLSKLVSDLDARRVFRAGDKIQIEASGEYVVSSVDSSQITLTSSASWGNGKGVWFPWSGQKPDMGAYEYGAVTGINDFNDYEKRQYGINKFGLYQNYPNPFNSYTEIKYQLPETESINLKIYNILSQEVKTLVNDVQNPGYYSAKWDGKDKYGITCSSGIYFYRIQAGSFIKTKKMLLLK